MIKKSILCCLLTLLLAGCADFNIGTTNRGQVKYSLPPPKPSSRDYYTIKEPLQCVPYVRNASGVQIFGNAHTWWDKAKGKYRMGATPQKDAVMVLSKTERLKYGHLAVVKRVINSRNIEVTHSNWGGDRKTRSIIYKKMRVVDTSRHNDWSNARFWHYPSASYGSVYKVSGFIYPN